MAYLAVAEEMYSFNKLLQVCGHLLSQAQDLALASMAFARQVQADELPGDAVLDRADTKKTGGDKPN